MIHAALIQGGAALRFLAAASRLERYRKGSAAFADHEWIGYGQRMSETNETEGKAARGGSKMTLNVRRTVESGHVRQSFSHGRSKSVLVEKKKRRAIGSTPGPAAGRGSKAETPAARRRRDAKKLQAGGGSQPRAKGQVLRQLSDEEKDARSRALKDARQRDAERARGRTGRRRRSFDARAATRKRTRSSQSARSRKTKGTRPRPRRARSARRTSASTS